MKRSILPVALVLVAACGGGEGADVYAEVAPGAEHTCATTDKGRIVCWGSNEFGQVGGGAGGPTVVPAPRFVLTGPIRLEEISSGARMSCAGPGGRGAICWGLGTTSIEGTWMDSSLTSVSSGKFACAVTASGQVPCWASPGATPVITAGIVGATEVSVGDAEGCAVGPELGILCWNAPGAAVRTVPTTAGTTYRGLSYGGSHACAIGSDSLARCFGVNSSGQLGDGTYVGNAAPQVVLQGDRPTPGEKFVTVSASNNLTCGVTTSGRGFCWGQSFAYPVATQGITFWRDLRAGGAHACGFARDDDGLYCWGQNGSGQTGTGGTSFVPLPEKVVAP